MPTSIVRYEVDADTVVAVEIAPTADFRPAGADDISGKLIDAISPAVDAATSVLSKLKDARPDEVELKFGVKATGSMNWLIAKAATEGNFEITLKWNPSNRVRD